MKKVIIITENKSDLSSLLQNTLKDSCDIFNIDEATDGCFNAYDSIILLGGTRSEALILPAKLRNKIEDQIDKGKKVFVEYCLSICDSYAAQSGVSRFSRLSYLGDSFENLETNDILDDQCCDYISSYFKYNDSSFVLVYKDHIMAHYNAELAENDKNNISKWALWFLKKNVLVCNFRLCNFIKARFAPITKWQSLIKKIILWLCDELPNSIIFDVPYTFKQVNTLTGNDICSCVEKALNWYKSNGILLDNGRCGVLEGMQHDIFADGKQSIAKTVRADCCGEVSLAFYSHYLISNCTESLDTFKNLQNYMYENLQIKGGIFDGMVRWSEVAWTVCYQDDVARAIIPTLLYTLYSGDQTYLQYAEKALDFLLKTTSENGIRAARTDNLSIAESQNLEKFKKQSNIIKCAHYNAYYHAALALAYKINGKAEYLVGAVKGLEAIMDVYPDTIREQSETEEMCRLVLPLAWLYWATGDDKHKGMLYRVCCDLQKVKCFGNAYLEWDTDYKAHCSRKLNTESSLLVSNGDPVVDMLYSVNWLPLGFSQAYLITNDDYFKELWLEIAKFFVSTQINSDNKTIDGCWARAYDPSIKEIYGIPHDVGWGPWAIETGWTVGEITAGLGLGIASEKIKPFI
ncbi:MAG: hypothetical protein A2Y17_07495 [Clostridiales bacterium GWF2_38_85]|nr:MAG: hypothetical protein A2Y17_07495 [Clostridiales bacterium GWF2_38_85]HBL84282.1 hypothetical protein [Clostridiales bacterium]